MPRAAEVFAAKLTYYRKLRELSQEELGKKVGLTRVTIGNYEAGRGFTLEGLVRIAEALNIEETDLLQAEEPAKPVVLDVTPEQALEVLSKYFRAHKTALKVPLDVAEHFEFVTNWNLVREVLRTIAPIKG